MGPFLLPLKKRAKTVFIFQKSGADSGWDAAGSEKPGGWGMGDTDRAWLLPQGCCAEATIDAASGFFSRATQRFGLSADWRLRNV